MTNRATYGNDDPPSGNNWKTMEKKEIQEILGQKIQLPKEETEDLDQDETLEPNKPPRSQMVSRPR